MIQRKTQDPAYWSKEFRITERDLEYLSNLLVEEERPHTVDELARALVTHRCQEEETLIARELAKGTPYDPSAAYEVGEQLVFPARGYAVGMVVGERAGRNPELGDFRVIQVTIGERSLEFAAQLDARYLQVPESTTVDEAEELATAEEIYDLYGRHVRSLLESRLQANSDFVSLADRWFLRDLLIPVNAGHLNLAEAVLDMAGGGPLQAETLLKDLDLPEASNADLQVFSLNCVLMEDDRFDEVGPAGEVQWFLRRLEPQDVQQTPKWLTYARLPSMRERLTSEMLELEQRLGDEWSDLEPPAQPVDAATVVLLYPHLRAGTLPLSPQLARLFPTGRTHRIRFYFVDAQTGEKMPGWVVRERRYIYGLGDWYRQRGLMTGSYIDLERGDEPGTIRVGYRPARARRDWIRLALPSDEQLRFEMRKLPVPSDYDELMVVAVQDLDTLDKMWDRVHGQRAALTNWLQPLFLELAKLSPQGTVHAATLYSALNLIVRVPPGPMLAELAGNTHFFPVGDNYWVYRGEEAVV